MQQGNRGDMHEGKVYLKNFTVWLIVIEIVVEIDRVEQIRVTTADLLFFVSTIVHYAITNKINWLLYLEHCKRIRHDLQSIDLINFRADYYILVIEHDISIVIYVQQRLEVYHKIIMLQIKVIRHYSVLV